MKKRLIMVGIVILLLVFVPGCNFPAMTSAPVEEVPATPPEPTAVPPTEVSPTEAPTEAPLEESTALPTEVLEIVHVNMPLHGDGKEQIILDQVSQHVADEKRAYGGDEYGKGRYERPFLVDFMTYLPYIDIEQTALVRDEEGGWMYVTIQVVESPVTSDEHQAIYGVELDSDLDGRGDVLILANAPASEEWTTDGVQVWLDVNENVGGMTPMRSNAPAHDDGYEFLVFDEGKGEDADLAWARLSPDAANEIEVAFKLDLVDVDEEYYFFLWGAWAFVDDAHPEWFDHHDKFFVAEAGSPLKDNIDYPLKQFFGADNTCRALSGWSSPTQLPGMCPMGVDQASGGDGEETSCEPIYCCKDWPPSSACPLYWDPDSCSCIGD